MSSRLEVDQVTGNMALMAGEHDAPIWSAVLVLERTLPCSFLRYSVTPCILRESPISKTRFVRGVPSKARTFAFVLRIGKGKYHADSSRQHLYADQEILKAQLILWCVQQARSCQNGHQETLQELTELSLPQQLGVPKLSLVARNSTELHNRSLLQF